MDPGTLIGIGLAFAAVFGSMIMEGGNPASILLPPALLLVFLGTFGVAMACGLLKDATGALAAVKTALMGKKHSAETTVATLVSFAERARREGLLALEEMAKSVDDPFMKQGHRAGRRRHRPRRAARHHGGRDQLQEERRQGGVEVLRRHGRLRPDARASSVPSSV